MEVGKSRGEKNQYANYDACDRIREKIHSREHLFIHDEYLSQHLPSPHTTEKSVLDMTEKGYSIGSQHQLDFLSETRNSAAARSKAGENLQGNHFKR
jgi:hypothetical protein